MRHPAKKNELPWRIEEACFKAWPAVKETPAEGWVFRVSGGLSRRANSANSLKADVGNIEAVIASAEKHFRDEKLPVIFRITSLIDPAMHERLAKAGYTMEGESLVLHSDIKSAHSEPDANVELLLEPTSEWFGAMSKLQKHDAGKRKIYRKIIKSITVPAAYAVLRDEGKIVSLAYGTIHNKLLCFESVITAEEHRGKGNSRRLLAALVAWARTAGAEGVCLQVQADNDRAVALYNGLGLKELYRYHYMREPVRN